MRILSKFFYHCIDETLDLMKKINLGKLSFIFSLYNIKLQVPDLQKIGHRPYFFRKYILSLWEGC